MSSISTFYDEHINIFPELWFQQYSSNVLFNHGVKSSSYDIQDTNNIITYSPSYGGYWNTSSSGHISVSRDIIQDVVMNTHEYSISYWKRYPTGSPAVNTSVDYDVCIANSTSSNTYLKVFITNNQIVGNLGNGNNSLYSLDTTLSLPTPADKWFHVAITLQYYPSTDQHELRIYINKNVVKTITVSNLSLVPITDNAVFRLNADRGVANFRDFRMWRINLEPETIHKIYNTRSSDIHLSFDTNTFTHPEATLTGTLNNDYGYLFDVSAKTFTGGSYISIPSSYKTSTFNLSTGFTITYWKKHISSVVGGDEFYSEGSGEQFIKITSDSVSVLGYTAHIAVSLLPEVWYNISVSVQKTSSTFNISIYIDGELVGKFQTDDVANITETGVVVSAFKFGLANVSFQEFRLIPEFMTNITAKTGYIEQFRFHPDNLLKYRPRDWITPDRSKLRLFGGIIEGTLDTDGKIVSSGSVDVVQKDLVISKEYPGDPTNVMLWWRFDTSAVPINNYGNDTSQLAITTLPSGISLISGRQSNMGAVSFNSVGASITVSNSSTSLMDSIRNATTLMFWNNGADMELSLCGITFVVSATEVSMSVEGIGGDATHTVQISTSTSGWNHWACSFDGINMVLYRNGLIVGEKRHSGFTMISSTSPNIILKNNSLAGSWCQDVRVYRGVVNYLGLQSAIHHINGVDIPDCIAMYDYTTRKHYYNITAAGSYPMTLDSNGGTSAKIIDDSSVISLLNKITDGGTITMWVKNTIDLSVVASGTTTVLKTSVEATTASFELLGNTVSINHNATTDTWHHWTFHYDTINSELSIWMNGEKKGYIALNTSPKINSFTSNIVLTLTNATTSVGNTRIYSRSLTFHEIARVFNDYGGYDNHLDQLLIWYRLINNTNNHFDNTVLYDGVIPTTSTNPPIYTTNDYKESYQWVAGSGSNDYITITDNTLTPITYNFTAPLSSGSGSNRIYVSDINPITLTKGRIHRFVWPDISTYGDHPIKITDQNVWGSGSSYEQTWISYDTTNRETVITLPYVLENTKLYFYCQNHQNMGVYEMDVLETEQSVYRMMRDMTSSNFTVMGWVKTQASSFNIININKVIDGSYNNIISAEVGASSIRFRVGSGDGTNVGTSSVSLNTDGEWHHWAFVYDGRVDTNGSLVMKVYRDGTLVHQDTINTEQVGFVGYGNILATDTLEFKVGSNGSDGTSLGNTAYLTDLRVYRVDLTEEQISKCIYSSQGERSITAGAISVVKGNYNPYALQWNNYSETFVEIPPNFMEKSQGGFQMRNSFWFKPTEIDANIKFLIGDVFSLDISTTTLTVSLTPPATTDKPTRSTMNATSGLGLSGTNLPLNNWYNVDVSIVHYGDQLVFTLNVKDTSGTSAMINTTKTFGCVGGLRMDDNTSSAKIERVVWAHLDDFKVYGAKQNLIIHYTFESASSPTNNAIDNLFSGGVDGTGTFTLSTEAYINNSCLVGEGYSGAYIDISGSTQLVRRFSVVELSVMYWKKDMDILTSSADMIVKSDSTDMLRIVSPDENGAVVMRVKDSTGNTMVVETEQNKILTNVWYLYLFVIRFDGIETVCEIFLNSLRVGYSKLSNFVPFVGSNATKAYLGGDGNTSDNSDVSPAMLEDFKVYNTALREEDAYRLLYVNSASVDGAIVSYRFQDISSGSVMNLGTSGSVLDATVVDLTGTTISGGVGTIINNVGLHYYRSNNNSLYWRAPDGNQYLEIQDASKIVETFNNTGRMSIMFKQRVNTLLPTSYTSFQMESGNNTLMKITAPTSTKTIEWVVGNGSNIYSLSIPITNTAVTINSLWISWVFTVRTYKNYLYLRVYRDGALVPSGKKTLEVGGTFIMNVTGGTPKAYIGKFRDNVYMEDFKIYDRVLTYTDFPALTSPRVVSNDKIVTGVTNNELFYNLPDYFSGYNLKYVIEQDIHRSALITDDNRLRIVGDYRGTTHTVTVRASNRQGYTFWSVIVTEINAPPIQQYFTEASGTLTFDLQYGDVGAEGTESYNQFVADFQDDISTELGIDPENVVVDQITYGSVIVDFRILPDRTKPLVNPAVLMKEMKEKAENPASNFRRRGKLGKKLQSVKIPPGILKRADNPDTEYIDITDDLPIVYDLTEFFQGINIGYSVKTSPHNNVSIDLQNQTMTIIPDFRNATYTVEVSVSNPSSAFTLTFEITEPQLTPPTALDPVSFSLGDNEMEIDIRDYIIGKQLNTFSIVSNPKNNVVLVNDSIFKITGSFRNELYSVVFRASNSTASADWTLNVKELPLPPTRLIDNISVSLTDNKAEYTLSSIFAGDGIYFGVVEGTGRESNVVITDTTVSIQGDLRGKDYDVGIFAKNDTDDVIWTVRVTEGYPPAPTTLLSDQNITIGLDHIECNIAEVFDGIKLSYEVGQYLTTDVDPNDGIKDYLQPSDHQVFIDNPPWARYHAKNWDISTNTLPDTSGNARDAIKASASTSGIYKKSIDGIDQIYAEKGGILEIPSGLFSNGTTTICSISRYTSGILENHGRIIGTRDDNLNIIHGHWSGNRGVVSMNGFITNVVNVGDKQDWLICCSKTRGVSPNNVLIDNIAAGTTATTELVQSTSAKLYVNGVDQEKSEWALSHLLVWDTELSDNDLATVSQILTDYIAGTASVQRERREVINYLNTYNNITFDPTTDLKLSLEGYYRGVTYDVYVQAKNAKDTAVWTLTVTEVPPPPPTLLVATTSERVTYGDFVFNLSSYVSGFNIQYVNTITTQGMNDSVSIDNDKLIINSSYRNLNYNVSVKGSNLSGEETTVFSITETGTLPPESVRDKPIYYFPSLSTAQKIPLSKLVYGQISNVSIVENQNVTYDTTLNELSVSRSGTSNSTSTYPISMTFTNPYGTLVWNGYIVEGGYQGYTIPSLGDDQVSDNIYSTSSLVEYNLKNIRRSTMPINRISEYSFIYNPYSLDKNDYEIDNKLGFLTINDKRRGTYDIVIGIDGETYVLRVHERPSKDINLNLMVWYGSAIVNKMITNNTGNPVMVYGLLKTVPPYAKYVSRRYVLDSDIVIDLKNLFSGYIKTYRIIQEIDMTNATLEGETLKLKWGGYGRSYEIMVIAENDYGSANVSVDVSEKRVGYEDKMEKFWLNMKTLQNYIVV